TLFNRQKSSRPSTRFYFESGSFQQPGDSKSAYVLEEGRDARCAAPALPSLLTELRKLIAREADAGRHRKNLPFGLERIGNAFPEQGLPISVLHKFGEE